MEGEGEWAAGLLGMRALIGNIPVNIEILKLTLLKTCSGLGPARGSRALARRDNNSIAIEVVMWILLLIITIYLFFVPTID